MMDNLLDSLSYSQLQTFAKKYHIKANAKATILRQSLAIYVNEIASSLSEEVHEDDFELAKNTKTYTSDSDDDKENIPPPEKSFPLQLNESIMEEDLSESSVFQAPLNETFDLETASAVLSASIHLDISDTPSKLVVFQEQPVNSHQSNLSAKSLNSFSSSSKSTSSGKQLGKAPNFKRIHQRAFDKMESLESFSLRRATGISNKHVNTAGSHSFTSKAIVNATTRLPLQERSIEKDLGASCQPNEQPKIMQSPVVAKFDLKASLQRRLSYKPHLGPLKSITSSTVKSGSMHNSARKALEHVDRAKIVRHEQQARRKAESMRNRQLIVK